MQPFADFDWPGVVQFLPALVTGLGYTLLVSVAGLAIGFALGAVAGVGRISKIRPLYWISTVYVELIRGTPVLVQAIWI